MPVYQTPTTPRVLARERVPAMFRPGNQAIMEPADASNPAASQSFLPSLGLVRSGNGYDDNALAAEGDAFSRMVGQKRAEDANNQQRAAHLRQKLAQLDAQIQGSAASGQDMPAATLRRLQERRRRILNILADTSGQAARNQQAGGTALAPWQRKPRMAKRVAQYRKLPWIKSPATPNPEAYASKGFSAQKNRAQILAMQQNVQPVKTMSTVDGWFQDEMIPGVPNYMLAAGGGVLALALALRLRRRRRTERVVIA